MYEKAIIFFIFISFIFISCSTTRVVSDISDGTMEYRELQGEIRTGETELAITGTGLESTSKDIEQSVINITESGERLEQSISKSTSSESEIGNILQSIGNREVTIDKLIELGIIKVTE